MLLLVADQPLLRHPHTQQKIGALSVVALVASNKHYYWWEADILNGCHLCFGSDLAEHVLGLSGAVELYR